MNSKQRRIRLYWISHHHHQKLLEKNMRAQPVMLNISQFINSLQDKTWFQCSERTKKMIMKGFKLEKKEKLTNQKHMKNQPESPESPKTKEEWKALYHKDNEE
jgi:hypothetical protein